MNLQKLNIGFIVLALCMSLFSEMSYAKKKKPKYEGRLVPGVWEQKWNKTLKEKIFTDFFLNFKNDPTAKSICKDYSKKESKRKLFWHQLMVSLAYKESLHGPGNWVLFNEGINKGLYQINPELLAAYNCGPKTDLYDPIDNIKCGVKMAQKLTNRYGTFLSGSKEGMAAYWQPLRTTTEENKKNRGIILDQVTTACKTEKISYISTEKQLVANPQLMLVDIDKTFNDLADLPGEDLDLIMLDSPGFRSYTPEEAEEDWMNSPANQNQYIDDLNYYPLEETDESEVIGI
jgi:hypothetical protein